MKTRALIVEDDDRIIGSIEDSLFSIGHEHDWVTNQHDAQEKFRETSETAEPGITQPEFAKGIRHIESLPATCQVTLFVCRWPRRIPHRR